MRIFSAILIVVLISTVGFAIYQKKIMNPRVAMELRAEPQGTRAQRVMLMTIDDRATLPVNYLREGNVVYVGADGPWWRDLAGEGLPVAVLIKGEIFAGQASVVADRPDFNAAVFERLRPNVPGWIPDWLNGVLVAIELKTDMQTDMKEG